MFGRATRRALLAAGAAAALACGGGDRPVDVLVVSVDTLRADHLGAYGGSVETPNVDALAREGAVFTRASAPMPLTRPSHFSLLTARYPREHGVLNNAASLPETEDTLAEILAARGYRTAAFTAVRLLSPESGAAQGFEAFEHPTDPRELPAEHVVQRALGWLDGVDRDERFLLWVHLFDPHQPYAPPAAFRGDGAPESAPPLDWPELTRIAARHGGDVPAAVLAEARALYRGEVAYVDHWIGALLDGLAERRSLDDTLVVFTADHGECFENGIYFEHSDCLWEPGVAIPLIVRHPPSFRAGARHDAPASIVDVLPTVLRAARIEIPASSSGRPLQDADDFGDRHVLLQYPFYQPSAAEKRLRRQQAIRSVAGEPTRPVLLDRERVGIVGPQWKFMQTGDRESLYRIAPETSEPESQLDEHPDVADRMRDILRAKLQDHPLTVLEPGIVNDELLETLKALGYL